MIPELGYPPILIVAVLAAGLPLAVVRPYPAFLFAVVALTAGNADMFNATRLAGLGPYLNLGDACIVVGLVALVFDAFYRQKPLRIPTVILLLLLVLFIGAWQSFLLLGMTYETARGFRWALQLPLAFFLAANLVDMPARAKQFIAALLVGVLLATVQHMAFVWVMRSVRIVDIGHVNVVRTIAFMAGGMSGAFLLTGLVWRLPTNRARSALYLLAGASLLASILFAQTRSVWFAAVAAVPCLLVFFQQRDRVLLVLRVGVIASVLAVSAVGISRYVAPELEPTEIVAERLKKLSEDPRGIHVGPRARAFEVEMDHWLRGTLIFGRGLQFFQTIDNFGKSRWLIAFGHLGYVTYLSQLGLVGLFIYGIYLPLSVLRDARRLWRHGALPELRYLGLLTGASIIFLSIMFLMSSSYLSVSYFATGTLYGAAWALARVIRIELGDYTYELQEV